MVDRWEIEGRYYISPELQRAPCWQAILGIYDEIIEINQAFSDLLGDKSVRVFELESRAKKLGEPCYNLEDFEYKLGRIRVLLEIDLDALRRLIPNPEPDGKGLKLIRQLFDNHGLLTVALSQHIDFLKKLVKLASKTHHRGLTSGQRCRLMADLGLSCPSNPEEWKVNWDKLANDLLTSFRAIRCALESLIHPAADLNSCCKKDFDS